MSVRAHAEQDGLVVVELHARVEDSSSRRRNSDRSFIERFFTLVRTRVRHTRRQRDTHGRTLEHNAI
ncbi:hypothetical protein QQF64_028146 [Cirrhinus molitorella]|uniref:Transposase n=1 Tax=Cirrhinus molitorella TaxID=172907 RepID=A0ABR3N5S4_9TELE